MTNLYDKVTAKEVNDFHNKDDVDSGSRAHHHTLGTGVNQAARGSDFKALDELVAALDDIVSDLVAKQMPVGHTIMVYDTVAPTDYLLCDGAPFDPVTYPDLAAKLGGTNTPDFRDRVPVGVSGSKALGATNGADTVSLVKANIPSHVHDIQHTHTAAARATAGGLGTSPTVAQPTATGTLSNAITTNSQSTNNSGNGVADGLGNPVTAVDIQNKKLALNFYIKAR